jgi:exopolysaccharide biosynthesis polyprenyl glycosylphosphotransferase
VPAAVPVPMPPPPTTLAPPRGPSPARGASSPAHEPHPSPERKHTLLNLVQGAALLGDGLTIAAASLAAKTLHFQFHPLALLLDFPKTPSHWLLAVALQTLFLLALLGRRHVYDRHLRVAHHDSILEAATKSVIEWTLALLLLPLLFPTSPATALSQTLSTLCSSPLILLGLFLWRKALHFLVSRPRIAPFLERRILFLGWSPSTYEILQYLNADPTHPYRVVGYLQFLGNPPSIRPPLSVPWLGTIPLFDEDERLLYWIREERVDHVVVADQAVPPNRIASLSATCENALAQLLVIPSLFPLFRSRLSVDLVNGIPMLSVSRSPLDFTFCRALKRAVDIFGSLVGLLLSIPIVLICGTLIRLESPGSIFYRQRRLGLKGRIFEMIKMRSMRPDAESNGVVGWSTKDDPRRLKIGTFMRRYNLDEVPQFWNVLKGEMSLVGPRPERPELIPQFIESIQDYNVRHGVKPGMTGLAQIRGLRGDTEIAERISSDLSYIENWSLWKDFKIMVLTFFSNRNAH